jgi:hypothetical protein
MTFRNICKILDVKPKGERSHFRTRYRWNYSIKIYFLEIFYGMIPSPSALKVLEDGCS